jgi:hypothetical protein
LAAFRDLARTLKRHRDGVRAYMETKLTNGLMEAFSGLLQLAKRIARADGRLFGSTGSRHMMTGGKLLCNLWRAYGFRTPPNSLPNPLTRDHCGVWWMQNAGLWTHNRKFSPNKSPVRALIQKDA